MFYISGCQIFGTRCIRGTGDREKEMHMNLQSVNVLESNRLENPKIFAMTLLKLLLGAYINNKDTNQIELAWHHAN
jgi:hypothetical protein